MRIRIITLPKRLQCVAVLTTTRPVTQTHVVEVKRQSTYGVWCPTAAANGKERSNAPINIVAIKPRAITWVVESSFLICVNVFILKIYLSCYQL